MLFTKPQPKILKCAKMHEWIVKKNGKTAGKELLDSFWREKTNV
jgi:hypothetical protein